MRTLPAFCAAVSCLAAACQHGAGASGAVGVEAGQAEEQGTVQLVAGVAPPMRDAADAYAAAGRPALGDFPPLDFPDLHNVYRLSEQIVSGGEPLSEDGFQRLQDMGIRTILSVDGKAPDAEAARRHGMRYVHVPIQYKGITKGELLRIAKTFRELEGPFYVHCFHGRHRGPAAAAVGRLVLDGESREQAIAEMRQWCGTSSKYEGLYRTVAAAEIPTEAETEGLAWSFEERAAIQGTRHAMVEMARSFERLEALAARDWQADPRHPDIDPGNEAEILTGLFQQSLESAAAEERSAAYQTVLEEALERSRALQALLDGAAYPGQESEDGAAEAALHALDQACNDCHATFRNR